MRYLVLGGTGTVGSSVVDGLLDVDGDVRIASRSEERLDDLPEGVEGVVGDMEDPNSYDRMFEGVDRLFLLNPVSMTELHQGLAALNEAGRAGVERIVYLSVQQVEKGPHIPHFASKIAVESALESFGIPYTVLRPSNFYQNDLWFREAIVEHGVYPQPLGSIGVSQVDVRDIAHAAVRALTEPGFQDATYALVGPDALTGEDCARIWSEALNRQVRYAGDDLEAWREQALETLPAWMVYDFELMYEMIQAEGLAASEHELEATSSILGRPPRSFESFVREVASEWV
ncbi:MAG: SDR family oxidoreductase [Gemmatimonadota bacterium]